MGNAALIVAPDERGYLRDGVPAFDRRFLRVMSFHEPEGLAAVLDESGAYHVDRDGQPRYTERYREAFGFYCGLATVRDERGYFHIDAAGRPAHSKRFHWAGNFQEGRCPVQDSKGFHHVLLDGTPAYSERYAYAGDFRHGIAAVHGSSGAFHIHPDGRRLHDLTFEGAGVFHKGYAVASDRDGAFHIDKCGRPCHAHRFRTAEPFYNGVALCSTHDGRLVRLRENGYYEHLPSAAPKASLASIHSSLETGARVGLFVRHAERPHITAGWGNEVLLNEAGLEQALRLGYAFKGRGSVTVRSSPVQRCVQTGCSFAEGAGVPQDPATSTMLGSPGAFFDPDRKGELGVAPTDFLSFATAYLSEGRAAGMKPLEVACESLMLHLREQMQPGLTLFVTHDLFVAGLLSFLGLKRPTREDWAEFLEGVCITLGPDGRLRAQRFLGLEELSRC